MLLVIGFLVFYAGAFGVRCLELVSSRIVLSVSHVQRLIYRFNHKISFSSNSLNVRQMKTVPLYDLTKLEVYNGANSIQTFRTALCGSVGSRSIGLNMRLKKQNLF